MRRTNKAVPVLLSVVLLAGLLPAKTAQSSEKKKLGTTHKATTTHKSSTATAKSKSSAKSTISHSKKSTAHVQNTKSSFGKHGKKTKTKKVKGQQGIQPERAREIQAALIREHYLDGEPTGTFDERTKTALQKFQQDNGWQTKVIPDSRALIKLGLGPSKDGLLNPESAAMASPHELGAEREIPGGSLVPAQRNK